MFGDPAAAAKYWRYQHYWDDCALMSSADVVGEVTGVAPLEEDIIDMAQSTASSQGPGPIYIRPPDLMNGDMERLEQQLGAGSKVIASVNAELIWDEPVEDKDQRGNPAHNHTVVVTGVDTGNDSVHLNDSGSREGRDEQIPLARFVQAWDASNELMAVTT
jgi:hypothetical protein